MAVDYQRLFINAYIPVRGESRPANGVALAGLIVTLSTFVALYKSYLARGYLHFLGGRAKRGELREEDLPLEGWPIKRIKNRRGTEWACPWFQQTGHLLEPNLFLPFFIVATWIFLRWQARTPLHPFLDLGMACVLSGIILFVFCFIWVWLESKNELERVEVERTPEGETRKKIQ